MCDGQPLLATTKDYKSNRFLLLTRRFKKIVSMETKFEKSNSFRNLTIKGVFLEKERDGDINSKLRREGKA